MSEMESLVARAGTLTSKVDFWNSLIVWALFITAIGAVAVVVCQRMAFLRANELAEAHARIGAAKDATLAGELKEKDLKIAEAHAASAKATEGLGKANVKIAELNTQSEGLRAEAEKSRAAIASANLRAAEAKQHALEAELALEKFKQPRTISSEQRERILSKLTAFPETPYDLWVATDAESVALMESIDSMLREAKWKFVLPGGVILYASKSGVIAASGVVLHVPEEHRNEWGPAIIALRDALTAEGIPVKAFADTATGEKDMLRDRIHIQIGSKPID